jgi:hypothetical protein
MQNKKSNSRPRPFRKYIIARDKPGLCPACPEYGTCKALCQKVEKWVDQDSVGGGGFCLENGVSESGDASYFIDVSSLNREEPLDCDYDLIQQAWERVEGMRLKKEYLDFTELYYREGMKKCDIAMIMDISDQAVNEIHRRVVRTIRDRMYKERVYDTLKYLKHLGDPLTEQIFLMYFVEYRSKTEISNYFGIRQDKVYKTINFLLSAYKALDTPC